MQETIGSKLRQQRRRLGLTLAELAERAQISKPYLSLIETGRVANPPSDEKLRGLERALGFTPGELLAQAHLQRTPSDVRAVLGELAGRPARPADAIAPPLSSHSKECHLRIALQTIFERSASAVVEPAEPPRAAARDGEVSISVLSDDQTGASGASNASQRPAIAGLPSIACPDVDDPHAFAGRVEGDSMLTQYRPGDIVIFSPAEAPRDGDDCLVRLNDGRTLFRRVFLETSGAGVAVLRLQPRNECYRPQNVEPAQVAALFRAIYRYQRVAE